MKTLLLTLATAVIATLFSSCECCNTPGTRTETRHYDYKGRLIKEVKPSGNYNTYHYDGTNPDDVATSVRGATPDGSWKPRIP